MVLYFDEFLDESYLDSNNAPVYHFTSIDQFISIIKSNILKVDIYDNIFRDENIKFVSLTRNKNFNMEHYRIDIDIRIELDSYLLKQRYKIIPYDFFINQKSEENPKSSINRKSPFEFEEIILTNIKDIKKYIISIDFQNDSILDRKVSEILPELSNIKIYNNGKEY